MKRRSTPSITRDAADDDGKAETLSPALIRRLRRQLADSRDPKRYLIVSRFGRRFALYYNVSDDVYAMNDPARGTLFKRRKTAVAVRKLLGRRVQVIRCTTRLRKGTRVAVLARPRSKNRRSVGRRTTGER